MKMDEYVRRVRLCPLMEYNEHYWSFKDRKSHDRIARCYVVGKRRGGLLSCVGQDFLADTDAHCIRSAARDSTPRRLCGITLHKPDELREIKGAKP